MSSQDTAIKIEGLGKKYRIGEQMNLTRTFRETVMSMPRFLGRKARKAAGTLVKSDNRTSRHDRNTFWALRDINFEVKRGEAIGIIGRNGAGKSTLLKVLSRITHPTEGRAEIRGRVGALLEVGTGMHPELTGRENIFLNGAILGMRKYEIKNKFDEIVAFSDVEKFLDTPLKRYSSGMRVRLGFSIAAHLEPEILIVDEVLSVGDAEFRKKCVGKMQDVTGEGRTVLFVSHNMAAIKQLCEKVVLLNQGQAEAIGPVDEIISKYLSEVVSHRLGRDFEKEGRMPENKQVALRSITLRPKNRAPSGALYTTDEIDVEIGVESKQAGQCFGVTLAFKTEDGTVAFNTSSLHHEDFRQKKFARGDCRFHCYVPKLFLNAQDYSVDIRILGPGPVVWIHENDTLVFNVIDDSKVRAAISGKRRGVVAPLFDWQFEIGEIYK